MAAKTAYQRRLFDFMSDRFATQEPFTLEQLRSASGYDPSSFENYRSKQFGSLLVPTSEDKVRVSQSFRRFNTWQKFRDEVVSQKRRLMRSYKAIQCQRIMSFELFMPLSNEEWLREALDSLFYRDQMLSRIRAMNCSELERIFPNTAQDAEEKYLNHVCKLISKTFGGYSISHVSGRFKVGELKTRREVADIVAAGTTRYLVDETTAVVRFLFPCGSVSDPISKSEALATQIRWFFDKLFVETILEVVNGEDEVWLLESGFRSQLQVFRAED
jgi:hypothetical protein